METILKSLIKLKIPENKVISTLKPAKNFRGWIRNTEKRTVQGEIEGEGEQIAAMKLWLQKTGSPSSR